MRRLKRIKEKENHSKGEESDKFVLDSSGDIVDVESTIASHLKHRCRSRTALFSRLKNFW